MRAKSSLGYIFIVHSDLMVTCIEVGFRKDCHAIELVKEFYHEYRKFVWDRDIIE